jgi:YtkA-like protein
MKLYFRRDGRCCPLTRGLPVLLIFLIISLVGVTGGCTKSALQRSIVVSDKQITPQPPYAGPIRVNFKLVDASKPLAGAHITLEGDMTHAGMAPVFGEVREVSPGQYQGQVTLSMGGDWVVLLHITLPDGKKIEEQMDVPGVQSK